MTIGLAHYLTVAAILFTIGIFGIFLNRKNVIVILMSIELILLAVNINFVAFSAYLGDLVGQVFALFVRVAQWMVSGDFEADWTRRIDTLTAVMLVVVPGVSSLVHLYSVGYMHGDRGRPRFFSYLSFFTFAMLMLVTANNFLQMFFG